MAWKYKISLTIIGLCLIFSILMLFSYRKYVREMEETSLVLVDSGLSINYLKGNKIKVDNTAENYSFSVSNNTEEVIRYYIYLDEILTNKQTITYDLIEKNDRLHITNNKITAEDADLASFIDISPKETHSYELNIYEEEKLHVKAVLKVGIEDSKEEYFATTIINDNKIEKEAKTKIGSEVATNAEGLIELNDEKGISYYFRGKVENNYVLFANMLWRIVKINSDGSIKLVLNDYIDTLVSYYDASSPLSVEEKLTFSKTNIAGALTKWYQEKLSAYDKYLISSKYCVDHSISSLQEQTTYYMPNVRLKIDYSPITNCLGTSNTERIGLLSADEVVYAGASPNENNTEFYLHTKEKQVAWWTATPSESDDTNILYFEIGTTGKLQTESIGSYYRGVKPVITLMKKNYAYGKGTEAEPYYIKE